MCFWLAPQVMLLSQGKTIFLGGTQASIDFMRENGYPVPEFENPADHARLWILSFLLLFFIFC